MYNFLPFKKSSKFFLGFICSTTSFSNSVKAIHSLSSVNHSLLNKKVDIWKSLSTKYPMNQFKKWNQFIEPEENSNSFSKEFLTELEKVTFKNQNKMIDNISLLKPEIILIGEGSHGTHEFYQNRNEMTKQLIELGLCHCVLIEADLPDITQLNNFVMNYPMNLKFKKKKKENFLKTIHKDFSKPMTNEGVDHEGVGGRKEGQNKEIQNELNEIFKCFERFPSWMWANEDMKSFILWLRNHNAKLPIEKRCSIWGLDVYSLHLSKKIVIEYLEEHDMEMAQLVKSDYSCFRDMEPQTYGMLSQRGLIQGCKNAARDAMTRVVAKTDQFAAQKLSLESVSASAPSSPPLPLEEAMGQVASSVESSFTMGSSDLTKSGEGSADSTSTQRGSDIDSLEMQNVDDDADEEEDDAFIARQDEAFLIELNAQVVVGAEEYYRAMFDPTANSWNLRDEHFFSILNKVKSHLSRTRNAVDFSNEDHEDDKNTPLYNKSKNIYNLKHLNHIQCVVWAHNSHVGDARFTHLEKTSQHRDLNIGQLVKEKYPYPKSIIIGQLCNSGFVTAAHDWGAKHEYMKVNIGLPNSYEDLFHYLYIVLMTKQQEEENLKKKKYLKMEIIEQNDDEEDESSEKESVSSPCFMLDFHDNQTIQLFEKNDPIRLQRAIGVIYRPKTERQSHYYHCNIIHQFDYLCFHDVTTPVIPLVEEEVLSSETETYPSGF